MNEWREMNVNLTNIWISRETFANDIENENRRTPYAIYYTTMN